MAALTRGGFDAAIELLVASDKDLAAIVERCGPPPFWSRPPGFATLVYIILEQQVSLASAKAAVEKVAALMPAFTPEHYLMLSDEQLRSAGVSRQKTRYTRLLAEAVEDGSLPLEALGRWSDARARQSLTAITGIGNWTADIYLMVALRRPDLWPVGDLALVKALRQIKAPAAGLDLTQLEAIGELYRPYRSVATHILWRHYLHG